MSNQRNLTGEEAFAARCLITPLSLEEKWLDDHFDPKGNIPPKPTLLKIEAFEEGEISDHRSHRAPTPKTQPSSTLYTIPPKGLLMKSEAFEEGDIPDHRSQRTPVPESQASSTLYSIPQWQPPPVARPETTFGGGKGPLSRPQLPNPNPSFWQDPRLRSVASTQMARPVDNRQGYRHTSLPIVSPVPGILPCDKLDQRISIRPRGKTSAEVQFVLQPEFSNSSKPPFPHAILVIIHQFMIANEFVSPRRHIKGMVRKLLWKSLLFRLDLHESYDLSPQQILGLKRATTRVNAYVDNQSKEWLATGICIRPSPKLFPVFHICTQAWLRRDWDGLMTWPTQTTTLEPAMFTTSIRSEYEKSKIEEYVQSINSLVSERSTHRRTEIVDLTNEETETQHTSSTSRKRRASDHTVVPPPKRHSERVRPLADRLLKSPLSVLEEKEDIQFIRPHEKGFPMILDNIRHAHHTLEELAPKSAKDLAALQQNWADHGFPSSLTESLFVAQSYTLSMKSYLDNALDLLLLLEDCTSWKVDGEKFELELEYEESAMQSGLSRTEKSSKSVSSV